MCHWAAKDEERRRTGQNREMTRVSNGFCGEGIREWDLDLDEGCVADLSKTLKDS